MRQVSTSGGWSCGLTFEEQDLHCWGHRRHHLQEPGRYPPKFAKGPFKQVALGDLGVCVLHESKENGGASPHRLQCWGGAGGFSAEDGKRDYDQVTVGRLFACGVDTDSEVRCWGINQLSVLRLPESLIVV